MRGCSISYLANFLASSFSTMFCVGFDFADGDIVVEGI